jgi:hypothetical protein
MSVVNVIYGYKIFNYILIPKKYYSIPKISENDFSIIMCSYFKEESQDIKNYIEITIINQIARTNDFFIYLTNDETNQLCLNEITRFQNVNILYNQTTVQGLSYSPEMINRILEDFIKKNIFQFESITFNIQNITQINIDEYFDSKYFFDPQPIEYVLLVPYLFYRNNETLKKVRSNKWSILSYIKIKKEDSLNILFKINKKKWLHF